MTQEQRYKFFGHYFGYPECCIDYFIEHDGALGNPLGASVNEWTGFVPCPECAQKILDGEIKLKDLIKPTRVHSLDFPDDDIEISLKDYSEYESKQSK